ncbi:MAG: hypothetical protein N0E54_01020 [Candidatus Thiodiazotropha taylori]|nr:hypothetical protein [Candidatus Thiodiazotropha endolucinida]MCW4227299.1 hypothetical protein [Candidatus Thiodiazotropha taylori]
MKTDINIDAEAEAMVKAVLHNRQMGYIADVEVIFNQHPQTTWRQYSAAPPQFPKPIFNGSRRAWTRATLKGELIRRMTSTKAA